MIFGLSGTTDFEERPNHHHRVWLKVAWPTGMQERAFGGLKPSLRKKLEEVGETGILPKQLRGDSQRLLPGTVLTRIYDDIEHRVLVRGSNDFEYQGQRFKSLSAVVKRITGSHWSGPVFFGLKTPASKKGAVRSSVRRNQIPAVTPKKRCAVYTRKSTDEGLGSGIQQPRGTA